MKYTIRIDNAPPDEARIKQHMDFDKVYGQYKAAPKLGTWQRMRNKPARMAMIATIFAVGVLLFDAVAEEGRAGKAYQNAKHALQSQPAKPHSQAAPALGSPQATVFYRTLAQAPSTVWVELFAKVGEKRVAYTLPQSISLTVDGAMGTQALSVHRFDSLHSVWEELGKTSVKAISPSEMLPKKPTLETFISASPMPVVALQTAPFALDVSYEYFPELDAYDQVHWEQLTGEPFTALQKQGWDDLALRDLEDGTYQITFERGKTRAAIIARPLKGSQAYRDALAQQRKESPKSAEDRIAHAEGVRVRYEAALAEWERKAASARKAPPLYRHTFQAPTLGLYKVQ